jgi:hypothetical protein
MNGQSLPEDFNERLDKGCEHASFLKRVGFFAGRLTTNVLLKQSRVESYKIQQSNNLADLSIEIKNLSLVYNETDVNSGRVFSTDFKTIIDYLPNWKRNLKLAYPSSTVRDYTIANLELDSDLEELISQKISLLVDELNKYYSNSISLINESKENRNKVIAQDFQKRYINHFHVLGEKSNEFKIQLDEIFVLIQKFQKMVYDAENILVSKKELILKEQLAIKKQRENESAALAAENRKKEVARINKYLQSANFSIPYTVEITKFTKECRYCGKECELRESKVNEPNCGGEKICYDAWIELVGLNPIMTKYLAEHTVGGVFGHCPDSNCPERSNGDNHVWHQIDKVESIENWLYTPKGVFKN